MTEKNMKPYVLQVTALNRFWCKMLVVFIIVLSLSATVVALIISINFNVDLGGSGIGRGKIVIYFGSFGVLIFVIAAFIARTFAKEYELCFDIKQIHIKSAQNRITFYYHDITECFIANQTDYSHIRFSFKNGKKFKLYVGVCDMLSRKKQTILPSMDTLDMFFLDFKKKN